MAAPPGNPGNMSHMPSSSTFGLPGMQFSQTGVALSMCGVIFLIVVAMIIMHLQKGGRRRR